ncbi:MAG: hypothetical protein JO047_14780 [Alphaproteobacteria bacterium]|nr:hypothetical protein [Alphaproteobacteria bacterium]
MSMSQEDVSSEAARLIRSHNRSGMKKATVIAIQNPSDTLAPEHVQVVREDFRKRFGDATASQALRQIDRRLEAEKDVTGKHVQSAELIAREMTSPLLRATKAAVGAEADLLKADQNLAAARGRESDAREKLDQLTKDRERYVDPGMLAPPGMSYDDLQNAEAELAAAAKNLALATKTQEAAGKAAEAARKAVAAAKAALDPSYKPGEDQTKIKQRIAKLSADIDDFIEQQIALQDNVNGKEKALKERETFLQENRGEHSLVFQPGLTKPVEDAKAELAAAQDELAEMKELLGFTMEERAREYDRLDALAAGPAFRDTQQILDNLAGDERLQKLLKEMAPQNLMGKATKGVKSKLQPSELGKTAGSFVPVIGSAAVGAYEAHQAESEENRLNMVSGATKAFPVAQNIAQILERDAEKNKWKGMIKLTFGVIFGGLSAKIPGVAPSAFGAMMSPLTDPIGSAASNAASSLTTDTLVEHGIGMAAEKAVSTPIKTAAKKLGTISVEKSLPDPLGDERRKQLEQQTALRGKEQDLAAVELPEGSAFPSIPNPSSPADAWDLSDPDTARALLAYLGPGADRAMLGNSKTKETEQRRLDLRAKMFGTPPDVDVTKDGAASDFERGLVDELGGPRGSGGGPMTAQATPLQLMYAALGWRKT